MEQPNTINVGSNESCLLENQNKQQSEHANEIKKWGKIAICSAIFSISYNIGETIASLYFGLDDDSLSLEGFGLNSALETLSASIVVFQLIYIEQVLSNKKQNVKKNDKRMKEKIAITVVGVLLVLLAMIIIFGAIMKIINKEGSDASLPNLIIGGTSLISMFILYKLKLKAGKIIDSQVVQADAVCTLGCTVLSAALIVGAISQQISNHYFNYDCWYLDPSFSILIALFIGKEGLSSALVIFQKEFDGTGGCCAHEKKNEKLQVNQNEDRDHDDIIENAESKKICSSDMFKGINS